VVANEHSDMAANILATTAGRRRMSTASLIYFDTYYCGMAYAEHRQRWLDILATAYRKGQSSRDDQSLLLLAPRKHGKTELAVTFTLWLICMNRNIRVLWIGSKADLAKKRLARCKALLESARVQNDWCGEPETGFGPWRGDSGDVEWDKSRIRITRSAALIDPTIEAVGMRGAITGGHFDVIILDDVEDENSVRSGSVREHTREWFEGTLTPMLNQGGLMLCIGTRKHFDDLYGRLDENPMWQIITDKAIMQWPDKYEPTYEEIDGKDIFTGVSVEGEAKVLWPEQRPFEYMIRQRIKMGSTIFAREMQNEVVDDETAQFRLAWLKDAMANGSNYSLYEFPPNVDIVDIVQGWDLALVTDQRKADEGDRDFTVGVTWGRDAKGNRYLLGMRRERGITPGTLRNSIIKEHERFAGKVRAIAIEKNSFGELHFLGLQKTTDLPLKAHITGRNKTDSWEGVPSMAALFENGKVHFPSKTLRDKEIMKDVIAEFHGLGRERHDDIVMSMWIAETVLRKGGFQYRAAQGDDLIETDIVGADDFSHFGGGFDDLPFLDD